MKEMEEVYGFFTKLREEIKGLNLDEVGVFALRQYKSRLENLHRMNLELQDKSRKDDKINNEELANILNLGTKMWYEISPVLIPINEVIDIKATLAHDVAIQRRELRTYIEENQKLIEKRNNKLKKFKKTIEGYSDPALRASLEEQAKEEEEFIEELKNRITGYQTRIKELGDKLRILALGGKVEELEEIRKSTTGLTEDEARKLTEGLEDDPEKTLPEKGKPGIPGTGFEKIDHVTPLAGGTETPEELPVPPLTPPTPPAGGTEELPVPPLTGSEAELPVPPLTGGTETPGELPVPPLTDGTDSPEELPIPPLTEGTETPGELPVPPLTEGGETETEEPPVKAKVKQPKPGIWKKIRNVLIAAAYVLGAGLVWHSGVIAHNSYKNRVSPKPETETEEEIDTPEENEVPEETPEEVPENTEYVEPETTPGPYVPETTPEPTPEPTPTPTPTPEPTPTVEVRENDVVLTEGESAYDASTGVEVGYTGASSKDNGKTTTPQSTRPVENAGNGTVVVRDESFKADPEPSTLPRTGQEITEEEARKTMTEGESNNLNEAIENVNWDDAFNSLGF